MIELEPTLEDRVLRIEGVLGIRTDLRLCTGSEFWIVCSAGDRKNRALDYWGPYKTADEATSSEIFEARYGHVVVETPL